MTTADATTITLTLDEAADLLDRAEAAWHEGPNAVEDRGAFDAGLDAVCECHRIMLHFVPQMTTAERALAGGDKGAWLRSPWYQSLAPEARGLVRACTGTAGYDRKFAAAIRTGLSDADLRALLGRAFGIQGGSYGRGDADEEHWGGANPRVVIGRGDAKRKLEGPALLAKARAVFGIADPTQPRGLFD